MAISLTFGDGGRGGPAPSLSLLPSTNTTQSLYTNFYVVASGKVGGRASEKGEAHHAISSAADRGPVVCDGGGHREGWTAADR
jgi:hypothetical protein